MNIPDRKNFSGKYYSLIEYDSEKFSKTRLEMIQKVYRFRDIKQIKVGSHWVIYGNWN